MPNMRADRKTGQSLGQYYGSGPIRWEVAFNPTKRSHSAFHSGVDLRPQVERLASQKDVTCEFQGGKVIVSGDADAVKSFRVALAQQFPAQMDTRGSVFGRGSGGGYYGESFEEL